MGPLYLLARGQSVRFGSLFAGIGGFDLGLERAGMECAWQVEIDPPAGEVLARHFPNTERHTDVTDRSIQYEPVDLICGGFPCQDLSNAHTNGTRRALSGEKSGLWSEYRRAIEVLDPSWVVIENVAAFARWVPSVRADLSRLGYASVPLELQAGSFGAPHKRPRIFVVANTDPDGESLRALHAEVASLRPIPGASGHWGTPPPGGFRLDDGVPRGMERCGQFGNAVVPQVAEWLGRRIMEHA